MENRRKIIPIAIVVLMAFLLVPQLQQANASSKSPYESGRDHGCGDAGISDVDDRYINQDEKGPSFHTNEFMRGYNDGYYDCSGNDNNNNKKQGNDCWNGTEFVGKDDCDTDGLPLCSETEGVGCFDDKDYPEENDDNNNEDDNDKPNCNDVEAGTNCDGSEDEDSWLDDETEYYTDENDGQEYVVID